VGTSGDSTCIRNYNDFCEFGSNSLFYSWRFNLGSLIIKCRILSTVVSQLKDAAHLRMRLRQN
jgi:hypothetical protein